MCQPQDINLPKRAAQENGFCPQHVALQRPRTCTKLSPVEPCTCLELWGNVPELGVEQRQLGRSGAEVGFVPTHVQVHNLSAQGGVCQ